MSSLLPALSTEDQTKLAHTIREAVKVYNEIQLLKDGIKDVVVNVSKDLDIPLKDMNRAVRLAVKKQENNSAVDEAKEALDIAEEILLIAKI